MEEDPIMPEEANDLSELQAESEFMNIVHSVVGVFGIGLIAYASKQHILDLMRPVSKWFESLS